MSGLLVELDCSHKSFKFHLVKSGDRQEITRKHNVVQGAYKHSFAPESTARMRRRFSALSPQQTRKPLVSSLV